MLRYHNFDIVFAEIPDETTLAINLTGCPNRCPGCHSPHLQREAGRKLDERELAALLDHYGRTVTCVCFMGGDAAPEEVERLARWVHRTWPRLRVGWYSGREQLPEGVSLEAFDYIKLGPWIEACGPLTSPSTNQRLYHVVDGRMTDITARFRRRAI